MTGEYDTRVDPVTGTMVHVVGNRQQRPNLPSIGCPFCVGGIEAPEPYDVTWFRNRWPAMPDDRCEVVLYTSDHDATFATLGVDAARTVVDLWAARTMALGDRDDVDYVLIFENRGPEVGATIAHPHGQIYAYDHVPARQTTRIRQHWRPDPSPHRLVVRRDGFSAYVPHAPVFPVTLEIAPESSVPGLAQLDGPQRDALSEILVDVMARLDRLYDEPLPYMLWVNQAPTTTADGWADEEPWLNIEIVSPWRSAGVPRFIAAAEIASDEYFNPVIPEQVAEQLRELGA